MRWITCGFRGRYEHTSFNQRPSQSSEPLHAAQVVRDDQIFGGALGFVATLRGQEMTFLEALRKIRPLIESGQERYICIALLNTGSNKYIKRIERQLGGEYTYIGWLITFHPRVRWRMTDDDFRQGRLQWIDYMIAQELKK
jgi:hypothetical protein